MNNLTRTEINKNIDLFFSTSGELFGSTFNELLDSLGIKNHHQASKLPLTSLLSVFNALNVTLDSVVAKKVDFNTIMAQFHSQDILPEKYTRLAPLSSRFTAAYMLDYIEKNFGTRYMELVMQRHQLRKSQFVDLTLKNNILLSTDLTQYLYEFQGSEAVEAMGANSTSLLTQNTILSKMVHDLKTIRSMFECFFEHFAPEYVEKNYRWQIEDCRPNNICISGRPTRELTEKFDTQSLISRPVELLRKGFLHGLPQLFGDFIVNCKQLRSISNGDDHDRYEISYFPRKHLLEENRH
jgi:hypothetical protein